MEEKLIKYGLEALAFIIFSIGVLIFKNYDKIKGIYLKRKADQAIIEWETGVEDMRTIDKEHRILHDDYGIPRNNFFIAHNGGSVPTKEENFYTAVKGSWGVDSKGEVLSSKMQRDFSEPIRVDFHYASLIEEARQEGFVHLITEEMPDSILKNIYEAQGVAESIVLFYSFRPNGFRFTYSSHARYKNDDPFTEDQITAIQLSGNRLRVRFDSDYK